MVTLDLTNCYLSDAEVELLAKNNPKKANVGEIIFSKKTMKLWRNQSAYNKLMSQLELIKTKSSLIQKQKQFVSTIENIKKLYKEANLDTLISQLFNLIELYDTCDEFKKHASIIPSKTNYNQASGSISEISIFLTSFF